MAIAQGFSQRRRTTLVLCTTAALLSLVPACSILGQSFSTNQAQSALASQIAPASQAPVVTDVKPAPILLPAQSATTSNQSFPVDMSFEQIGDLHMARKRFQAAIEAFHQVPHPSAAVYNKIGMADQQMYMMDEAKKNYETSLKMNPKNPDVMNNLATVYYAQKEYSNAERFYRKGLKLNPKSAIIYKNLGTDLLAANKFKKGWECYQQALAIDPEVFERQNLYRIGEPTPTDKRGAINYYLAKSYARVGQADRAIGYLRMAIDEGFIDRKKLMVDREFASLHGISAFEQLLSEQRQ
jgi:tetratricopeptide (TPR) repeat protein